MNLQAARDELRKPPKVNRTHMGWEFVVIISVVLTVSILIG